MAGTARSQSTDPFISSKFHVSDTEGVLNLASPAAGFATCTMPQINIDMHEYKEGLWTYKRKFPGDASFDDVVLTKGVVKNDTSFYKWLLGVNLGYQYRTNIIIKHYHRDDISGLLEYTNAKPYREIVLFNALPQNTKLGSDLDAQNSDTSIEEVTISYEYFRLKINGQEVTPLTL